MAELTVTMDDLTPSQALTASSNRQRQTRRRNRPTNEPQPQIPTITSTGPGPVAQASAAPPTPDTTASALSSNNGTNKNNTNKPKTSGNKKRRNKSNKAAKLPPSDGAAAADAMPTNADGTNADTAKRRGNAARKRYPWRKHIPPGTVDPISLESLQSLPYPPFCLVASEPYDVVDWPVPETDETLPAISDEDRQFRILQEQWGTEHVKAPLQPPQPKTRKRHYHLYDGRALAYYMVSQLQFIDPLNRRDLTRDELVHLDQYLNKNGFRNLKVVEAYDAQGLTISTAGAAATTAAGRAALLQQEAQILLNALFGGLSVSASRNTTTRGNNDLRSQYQRALQDEQVPVYTEASNPYSIDAYDQEQAVFAEGGLRVVDDNLDTERRGEIAGRGVAAPDNLHTLWSASRIVSAHGAQRGIRHTAEEFPSLAAVAPTPAASLDDVTSRSKKPLAPSKTLSRIGSAVKKTDPDEVQRQWEAREEARRKAMLSNLTFGSNPAAWDTATSMPDATVHRAETSPPPEASAAQLERNRNLAEALGVHPASVRQNHHSGWARPAETQLELDEYGTELNRVIYPDALIVQARENMGQVLKLEKKWKKFLTDESAASLPLNPMGGPMRKFVHEYSDYWKLHTESFDPEPKRYIHCVKLRDTGAPYPLLSDAARNWQGSRTTNPRLTTGIPTDHTLQQVAGQTTRGREIPAPPNRSPLPLKARSHEILGTSTQGGRIGIGGVPTRTMAEPGVSNSRFESLAGERERPKLQLQKRTLPVELPPYEPPQKGFDLSEELQRRREKMEEAARKEQEQLFRQQRALEAAFASDDEPGSSESDWVAQEEAYASSDGN